MKGMPAIQLTNLTFPMIGDDVHSLLGRSIVYNARNERTVFALMYGSPWALMKSYNPRNIIASARSIVSNSKNSPDTGKNHVFVQYLILILLELNTSIDD